MMIYEKFNPKQIVYLESHFVEIMIIGIIIGIFFLIWMMYMLKTTPQIIERPYEKEFPNNWFGNLAKLIIKNSQKKEKHKKSYEFYSWKNNGYEMTLYISWQDFYDELDAFDLPILMSVTICIYKSIHHIKKEVFCAYSDKNNYALSNEYYINEYNIRKNTPITIRIKGKEREVN